MKSTDTELHAEGELAEDVVDCGVYDEAFCFRHKYHNIECIY